MAQFALLKTATQRPLTENERSILDAEIDGLIQQAQRARRLLQENVDPVDQRHAVVLADQIEATLALLHSSEA